MISQTNVARKAFLKCVCKVHAAYTTIDRAIYIRSIVFNHIFSVQTTTRIIFDTTINNKLRGTISGTAKQVPIPMIPFRSKDTTPLVVQAPVLDHSFIRQHNQQGPRTDSQVRRSMGARTCLQPRPAICGCVQGWFPSNSSSPSISI